MEIIPTNNEINCAIFVCFLKLKSFVIKFCISSVQLVATEFNPVDKVDCYAAYIAANNIPVTPAGS